jgi:hypothetical protein
MGTNYNTAYNFVKKNYSKVGFQICPSDSHPSGGFPVSDLGLQKMQTEKSIGIPQSPFPNLQSLGLPHSKKMKRNWTLIFTCDWLKIVLNKNNLIKGYCYEGKIAKPQLPI